MSSLTTFFDDAASSVGKNEKPALAQIVRRYLAALNAFAARPRPILNWIGGNDNFSEDGSVGPQVRGMWFPTSVGAPALGGQALVVPIADSATVPLTGLRLNQVDHDQIVSTLIPQTPGRREDINDDSEIWYPKYATAVPLMSKHVSDYSSPATAREIRFASGDIGGGPTYGPQLRSGAVWEKQIVTKNDSAGVAHPVIGTEAMPLDHLASGSEIIGEGTLNRDLRAFRDLFNRLYKDKRIAFTWGINDNTASAIGVTFTTTTYRYIFDQNYGQGGTAPTVTGPGIPIPARYTARGRNTTLRCYVRVFAAMSGATDAGDIAVYNRNDSGTLTGPTTLNNPSSITGTTFAWYPSGNFNESTDPYFLLNANTAYLADHVLLCGRRTSGATDNLIINACSFCVRPA